MKKKKMGSQQKELKYGLSEAKKMYVKKISEMMIKNKITLG